MLNVRREVAYQRLVTVKDPLATRFSELSLCGDKLLAILLIRIDQPQHLFAFLSSARSRAEPIGQSACGTGRECTADGQTDWHITWEPRRCWRPTNREHPAHNSLVFTSATYNPVPVASMMTLSRISR